MKLSFQSPHVHIDLMVLAQKVDNRIVPKSPFKVMFYYQPLICGTAQTFLFASLYCSTLPTECFTALKLPATFMANILLRVINDYKLYHSAILNTSK